ncbi:MULTISPECIES: type III pantothenate kinase [Brevibacillus]|jgi:type III pantothenate kinase|uniref:type III pantothenate kinase n=1 Tax=Brevibacillus TaxID=55080 RepID=UPI000F07EB20|nr:type III pantothenate kinase [Brevibacillus borstelensis]MCC0566872.1 type III pantothenate kinase [Brevibacillus borstelensis]MED1881217.1 type III pantothenate kinase [Brevibacillus borstelensis]RNB62775.1 type III pantothenate kinase [Brevibacillus borstelensis]GED55111.1 type III pantothenate kinase [Brevibacillus borstelensis]
MLLVMDIGNSNIVMGLYEGETLRHHWRVATDRNKTEDEYGMLVRSLFDSVGLTLDSVDGVIISSVVPPINVMMERMCEKYLRHKPLIVGPGIKTGLNIKYEYPREVGTDRIVNAVAAIHEYGTPLIVVDFGTATTFCYVDERGQYWGGAIAPGIGISTEALVSRAAKLPRIEIAKPSSVVGRNTISAMQAGIYYGFVGQVEGIVRRIKAEYGTQPTVVATGGLAPLIANEAECIDVVDGDLTLKGLRLIYERNQ